MDWQRYKQLCDQPNVFSRWMLEQTLELVDSTASPGAQSLAQRLAQVLRQTPVAKPADHTGESATDMLVLAWSIDEVVAMVDLVKLAMAEARTSVATRQRGRGGFVEAWGEYARHLAQVR